ncbi:heat-shock protein [Striga asiatica]|uniref:Heat-shock protein n=1 Tax=Striga asiatica TaxID=4170 RepID=A0A5A7P8X9_STRAF|nr:heat-shock protein [Striga asiatica]
MAKFASLCAAIIAFVSLLALLTPAQSLVPYTRPQSIFDLVFPAEDPFRILEHSPLSIPRVPDDGGALALARADWRETPAAHEISLDIPGMKREDIRIEVEENRVLRVSGERRTEEEVKDERWHRVERTAGKFWRQFRLPADADMEKVSARLEDGVLRISVPKLAEKEKKEPKVISIEEKGNNDGVVKPTKQEL